MKAVPQVYIRYFMYLVYAGLILFASTFWFERMNSDAGYYLFRSMHNKFFHVEHGRYVLALAELPALLGVWLGLSLKTVVWLYSIGHVLFFAGVSALCWRLSGNYAGALLVTLIGFVGLRESVYTPQFELYYGLVCLVLAYIFYVKNVGNWNGINTTILCLVLFFVITSHPMAVLCMVWLFLMHAAWHKELNYKALGVMLAGIVLYIIWKKVTLSGYEGGKFIGYKEAITNGRLLEAFQNGNFADQLRLLARNYADVLLLFLFGFYSLCKAKKVVPALLYFDAVVFFLLLVWLQFPQAGDLFRYLEQVFYPFVFVVLCYVLFTEINYVLFGVLLLSLVYRGVLIMEANKTFVARTVMMDGFIAKAEKNKGQRFVVTEKDMGAEQYGKADWSYGFETLVRAAATRGKSITIATEEDYLFEKNDSSLRSEQYLFRRWEREPVKSLNQKYFSIDTGRYEYLTR